MRTLFLVLFLGLINSCVSMNSPHPVIGVISQSPISWYTSFYAATPAISFAVKRLSPIDSTVVVASIYYLYLFSNLFINSSLGELTSWVYKKYSYPILVTDLKEQGEFKKGRACSESILGLFATGDASIEAAKDNNNIKRVLSVSQDTTSVLGLYAEVCTVVAGN
jgi:hypothetical protein